MGVRRWTYIEFLSLEVLLQQTPVLPRWSEIYWIHGSERISLSTYKLTYLPIYVSVYLSVCLPGLLVRRLSNRYNKNYCWESFVEFCSQPLLLLLLLSHYTIHDVVFFLFFPCDPSFRHSKVSQTVLILNYYKEEVSNLFVSSSLETVVVNGSGTTRTTTHVFFIRDCREGQIPDFIL